MVILRHLPSSIFAAQILCALGDLAVTKSFLAFELKLKPALSRRNRGEGGNWGMNNHWPDAPAPARSAWGGGRATRFVIGLCQK
jgi:hypothetical protein